VKDTSPEYINIRSSYTFNGTRFTAVVLASSPSRKVEVTIKRNLIFDKSVAVVQTGGLFYVIYTVWLVAIAGFGLLIFLYVLQ